MVRALHFFWGRFQLFLPAATGVDLRIPALAGVDPPIFQMCFKSHDGGIRTSGLNTSRI